MKISVEELVSQLAKIESDAHAAIPDGWNLPGRCMLILATLFCRAG